MVIRKGKVIWGSDFSTAEVHLTEESANTAGDSYDSFSERQCPVVSNSNPPSRVKWKNTFHMRQLTLANIPTNSGQVRQTLSAQAADTKLRGRYMTSASKSLDLLRLNIQTVINKEIDAVLKKYLDKFFKPAIENIRNNLGENSVTEDNIRLVCRQILEDAKVQYYSGSQSRTSSPYSDSESGSFVGDFKFGPNVPRSSFALFHNKKKESDTDSEASQSTVKPRKKTVKTLANVFSGVPTPVKLMKLESLKREGPKWDPNRIVKSTLFIMGAKANKVLGFGQTRGRLYTKHPELLKYSGDTEDKEWLSRHNLMPPTGGIAYLLVLEDVKELAESEEYRHNPNVLYGDLKGFEAPDFMLRKIRAFVAQARTDGKNHSSVTYISYNNEMKERCLSSYNMECSTVLMTPPSTILGSAPGAPCEPLEFVDCSSSLFASAPSHDFFSTSSLVYDDVCCDNGKSGHPFLYSSSSALSSLLTPTFSNENSQDPLLR